MIGKFLPAVLIALAEIILIPAMIFPPILPVCKSLAWLQPGGKRVFV